MEVLGFGFGFLDFGFVEVLGFEFGFLDFAFMEVDFSLSIHGNYQFFI